MSSAPKPSGWEYMVALVRSRERLRRLHPLPPAPPERLYHTPGGRMLPISAFAMSTVSIVVPPDPAHVRSEENRRRKLRERRARARARKASM